MRRVELNAAKITDAGLTHLQGLTRLQSLSLATTNITGSGLSCLNGLSQLQSLDLTGTKVASAGLAYINGPSQRQNCIWGAPNHGRGFGRAQASPRARSAIFGCDQHYRCGTGALGKLTSLNRLNSHILRLPTLDCSTSRVDEPTDGIRSALHESLRCGSSGSLKRACPVVD